MPAVGHLRGGGLRLDVAGPWSRRAVWRAGEDLGRGDVGDDGGEGLEQALQRDHRRMEGQGVLTDEGWMGDAQVEE